MIRSEWIKLWSVRSTYYSLGIAAVMMATIAGVIASTSDLDSMKGPTDALAGGIIVQLVFGVLGAMFIGSEYSTGQICTTFAAVPQRRKAMLAKGGVMFAVLFVAGQLVTLLGFFVAEIAFTGRHVHMAITDHGTAASVAGMGFFMCFVGMFGFAIGVLLRNTAAAVATMVGIVFLLMSLIPRFFPDSYRDSVGKFTFTKLAQAMVQTVRPPTAMDNKTIMTVGDAWITSLIYIAISIAIPFLVINRRDAV